jgi:hypothetical protein
MVQRVSRMWSSQGAKDSNKMNGTKSSLPYALGVSLERTRNGLPQVGKEKRANGSKTDQEHPQPPGEATPSSPWTRNRGQGRKSESDEDEEERFEWGQDVSSTPLVCWTWRRNVCRRSGVHHTRDQDTSPLSTRRCETVVNHKPDGMGSHAGGQ